MFGQWKPRQATTIVVVALVWGCRSHPDPGSLDAGWVDAEWLAVHDAPRGDTTLVRADAAGGIVISTVQAATQQLAARTVMARPSDPPRVPPKPPDPGPKRSDPPPRQPPALPKQPSALPKQPAPAAHMREKEVRAGLERFKFAQARLFRLKRAYAADPALVNYERPPGTTVRIVWANKWGWAALAADSLVPQEYCAVYVGSVPDVITPDARNWGKPGKVYCDGHTEGEPLGSSVLYGDETPDQTLVRYVMTMLPTNLSQLAVSQVAYRRIQYTYARRIEPMVLQYGWEPGVRVRMLFANSEGWSAEASYDLLPGRSCVIWGGTVPQRPATVAEHRVAELPSVPACDEAQ